MQSQSMPLPSSQIFRASEKALIPITTAPLNLSMSLILLNMLPSDFQCYKGQHILISFNKPSNKVNLLGVCSMQKPNSESI